MENRKSAKEILDYALESLNEISKLRMCSAVEDLVNKRVRLERHNITPSKYFPVTSIEEGDASSTSRPRIKNVKIVTKVRMIWNCDID